MWPWPFRTERLQSHGSESNKSLNAVPPPAFPSLQTALARSCADWLCAFRSVLMVCEERHKTHHTVSSHCVLRPHGWTSWEDVIHTKPLRFLEMETSVKAVRQLVWRQRQSCRENTFLCDSMGNMKMKSSISGNPGTNNLQGSCAAPEWTWFI